MQTNIQQFALNLINRNPQIAKNPKAQEMIDVIRRGDANAGMQIANNICNTYGISREQAVQDASKFFHL